MNRLLPLAALVSIAHFTHASATSADEIVPAEKAREYRDKACTVELVVRSSKHETSRMVFYLDSEEDYRDPKNLAVVISEQDLPKFREAGIEDPSIHYHGKRLRVRGKVVFEDDQYQIHVKDPICIETVESA